MRLASVMPEMRQRAKDAQQSQRYAQLNDPTAFHGSFSILIALRQRSTVPAPYLFSHLKKRRRQSMPS